MNQNVAAFLAMIGACEGADYDTLYGGGTFTDFSDHPRQSITAGGYTSTAAGRYQILAGTWDDFCKAVYPSKPLFDQAGQDWCAQWLLERRGAMEDVQAGRLEDALPKAGKEWASLPGSPYGQHTRSLQFCLDAYTAAGGTLADRTDAAAPVEDKSADAQPDLPTLVADTPPDHPMFPAIFAAVLPSLLQMIPQLGQIFSNGSEVAQRNLKAAQVVADVVTKTVGGTNLQDAVERMQADATARQQAQAAIEQSWYLIAEAGDGGLAGARKYSSDLADKGWKASLANPAVWVTLLVLPMPYLVLWLVLTGRVQVDPQVIAGLIGTVMGLSLGSPIAYWFGSTIGSQNKDKVIAAK